MQEDNIKRSIDCISASDETKNKIYSTVLAKNKALEEKKRKKTNFFKKAYRFALPAAACFCIMLLSAVFIFGGSNDVSPISHRMSDFEVVESEKDFEKIGVSLTLPSNVENPTFEIIDKNIASIVFDIDGKTFFLKASKISGDFSGITGEETITESFLPKNNGVISTVSSPDIYDIKAIKAYWTNGTVNFYLYSYDDVSVDCLIDVATSIITK